MFLLYEISFTKKQGDIKSRGSKNLWNGIEYGVPTLESTVLYRHILASFNLASPGTDSNLTVAVCTLSWTAQIKTMMMGKPLKHRKKVDS